MSTDKKPTIDGLVYAGDGAFIVGVPARDLTENDIVLIAASKNRKPDAMRDELLASPIYRASKPAAKKEP